MNCHGARRRSPADETFRLDIRFGLSLPPPQLEAAKFRLVSRATELRRSGLAANASVAIEHSGCYLLLMPGYLCHCVTHRKPFFHPIHDHALQDGTQHFHIGLAMLPQGT